MQSFDRAKIIVSGSLLEFFGYFRPPGAFSPSDRARSQARARAGLRRKISANAGQWWDKDRSRFYESLFLTLTFKDNILDVSIANDLFRKFIQRFNYQIMGSKKAVLKFCSVIEFQKRGAVHYHVILFNVPFIPDLFQKISSCWNLGYIFVNDIKSVKSIGSYVVKYMSKQENFDDRLFGKKTYWSSRGLLKPVIFSNDFDVARVMSILPSVPFSSYRTEDLDYRRYFLGDSALRYLSTTRYLPVDNFVDLPIDNISKQLILDLGYKGRK